MASSKTTLFDLSFDCLRLIVECIHSYGLVDSSTTFARLVSANKAVTDLFKANVVATLEPCCPYVALESDRIAGARALKNMCAAVRLPTTGKAAILMERLRPLCVKNTISGLSRYFEMNRAIQVSKALAWNRVFLAEEACLISDSTDMFANMRRDLANMRRDLANMRLDVAVLKRSVHHIT
jgi:hypothetical protein